MSCQNVVSIDNFWVVRVVTVTMPFLTNQRGKFGSYGCHCDNFLDDNHKAVLVTTILTTLTTLHIVCKYLEV